MAYKLSFDHPYFPKGHEFDIAGVGVIKNGSSRTLKEAEEVSLVLATGMSLKEYFENNEMVKVEGSSELSKKEVEAVKEGGES